MKRRYPEWVKTPDMRVTVQHGTGKSVVAGPVRIAFNGPNTVYVSTEAHHNDDAPAVTFRDREWFVDAHLTRNEDGTWRFTEDRGPWGLTVTQRGVIGGKAPKTFADAIGAAILATVTEHWTEERSRAGAYARSVQSLHSLYGERDEVAATLAEIDNKIALSEAIADANAPDAPTTEKES